MTPERRAERIVQRREQRRRESEDVRRAEPMHIIAFALQVLAINLYPAQATVLKIITLAVELFTPYDEALIDQWSSEYSIVDEDGHRRHNGTRGTVCDIRERIAHCRGLGRTIFREVILLLGRRGGKSHLVSILVTWHVWGLLTMDDPLAAFGLPPGKRLTLMVFGTNLDNNTANQFGDIAARIRHSPEFARFVDSIDEHRIRLFTYAQLRAGARRGGEPGLIEIIAAPNTASAGRGPTMYSLVMDEVAFADSGSTATAAQVYQATSPALAQFVTESFTVLASTPSTMLGVLLRRPPRRLPDRSRHRDIRVPRHFHAAVAVMGAV